MANRERRAMKASRADASLGKARVVTAVVLLGSAVALGTAACGHGGTARSTSTRVATLHLRPTPTQATQVRAAAALGTEEPVGLISADAGRVAYTVGPAAADCEYVSIWSPAKKSIVRVWPRRPAPCGDRAFTESYPIYELALGGSVVAWSQVDGCGSTGCGSELLAAVLPRAPQDVADDDGTDYGPGQWAYFGPLGHGNIFLLPDGLRVELPTGKVRRCEPQGDGYASVAGGLLAVYRGANIAVLDDRCTLVRLLRVRTNSVNAALLDRRRLVVTRSGRLDVYDIASGARVLTGPLPAGYRLTDVSAGIAVLRRGRRILVLRLSDGHSLLLWPERGPVQAEIEAPGLYYSYATPDGRGRLELVPTAELERQLGQA
jgi:hypothetical protein